MYLEYDGLFWKWDIKITYWSSFLNISNTIQANIVLYNRPIELFLFYIFINEIIISI